MRSLALILIAACAGSSTDVAAPTTPRVEDSMAGAGAVRLAFHVIPGREPALLLEAGGGGDSSSWGALPEQLATVTGHRVISYDRAGFGHSPFPAEPFTIADELAALHAGVHQVGATRIVPIAASYGALIEVAYARSYPADVAGFVFLDPMNAAFVDAVGVDRVIATVPKVASPSSDRDRAIARMTATFPALIAELRGAPWTAGLPVVVVSAATPPFPDADLQAAWRASHEALAKVPGATRILAEHSDHDIAEAEPAVVVSAVQRVLGGS